MEGERKSGSVLRRGGPIKTVRWISESPLESESRALLQAENDPDDNEVIELHSTRSWSTFIFGIFETRYDFIKLLTGVQNRCPLLESVLNSINEPLKLATAQAMLEHVGLCVEFGRCQLRRESTVMVMIVEEPGTERYIAHILNEVRDDCVSRGSVYRVEDVHYIFKSLPKSFERMDLRRGG